MECKVDPNMSLVGVTHAKVINKDGIVMHNKRYNLTSTLWLPLFFSRLRVVVWGTRTALLRPEDRETASQWNMGPHV